MGVSPIKALQHDTARAAALALAEIVEPLLREDERPDAVREFHAVIAAALAAYERERARLS